MSPPRPSSVIIRPVLLAGAVGGGLAYLVATGETMPPRVAAHFAVGGHADGWMDRSRYLAGMAIVLLALPLGSTLLLGVMRVLPVELLNIPNRDYWLAPAQRDATYRALLVLGADLGIGEALAISALHALVMDAQGHADILSDWSWKLELMLVAGILLRLTRFVRRCRRLPSA